MDVLGYVSKNLGQNPSSPRAYVMLWNLMLLDIEMVEFYGQTKSESWKEWSIQIWSYLTWSYFYLLIMADPIPVIKTLR